MHGGWVWLMGVYVWWWGMCLYVGVRVCICVNVYRRVSVWVYPWIETGYRPSTTHCGAHPNAAHVPHTEATCLHTHLQCRSLL